MLQLQRASAGSGKTYTLAKKFIWYYITVSEDNGPRRLRTHPELEDSLKHILAVTFTNKATGEMQQRIVEKLNALAHPTSGKTPDYMDEFCRLLGENPERISAVCKDALAVLLNNYSDFHVSTIDSFFQQILRTFAYETDLNDSYQIELDGKYLSRVGIDSVLEEINSSHASEETLFWINALMDRMAESYRHWNIFQRSDREGSIYRLFFDAVSKIENEDYKMIRPKLEAYFNSKPDMIGLYKSLALRYGDIPVKPYRKLRKSAGALLDFIGEMHSDVAIVKKMKTHAAKSLRFLKLKKPSGSDDFVSLEEKNFSGPTFKKVLASDPEFFSRAKAIYEEFSMAKKEWLAALDSREYRQWRVYANNFPYLGLLEVVIGKRDEYLRENNAVELAETNSILHSIIRADDTPFVYERLGARLNHFLIDEFQDTSQLQWVNLKPLLDESISHGYENLIIGDAKQSIYRFRNADPSLISQHVPETFTEITFHGDSPEENTNWRSDRTIVKFNNTVFENLSGIVTDICRNDTVYGPYRQDFRALYSNVVQRPHKKEEEGYVEIRIANCSKEDYMAAQLPVHIESLLDRGYRMRDIAILVQRKTESNAVIAALNAYNAVLPEGRKPLEFVSEQSLLVSSSVAVSLIISALETIARGADPQVRDGEESRRKGVADWDDVRCNFRFFAMRHPELCVADQLDLFLKSGADLESLREMLGEMQAVALPAVIEAVAATFVPEDLRKSDAIFIAAFQDMCMEYTASYPSDIASFLKWWERKGGDVAVSSPEDTDAIRVMTIHKSKGLEFPCVIIPFGNYDFSDKPGNYPEWRWVRPTLLEGEGKFPPYLPVDTTADLIGTDHEDVLAEYFDFLKMDRLNSAYVAFTRAVHELYVYCCYKRGKTPSPETMGGALLSIFGDDNVLPGGDDRLSVADFILEPDANGEDVVITVGKPFQKAPVSTDIVSGDVISEYKVTRTPEYLKYREESLPEIFETEDFEEEQEDSDPRSEGSLLHAVMERIVTTEDLPSAVRHVASKGLFSREQSLALEDFLKEKLSDSRVSEWFSPGWRVINERPVLGSRGERRPDRIMISTDGEAVVVDYKFGEVAHGKKHLRQVADYVERLKDTGRFRSVRGYLWYVKAGEVILVSQ